MPYHKVNAGMATRFNPTTNGDLHLGHVYIAMFNEYEAHTNNDKFYVRFEDNQPEWVQMLGMKNSRRYGERMTEALEWLGIQVDGYYYQSEMMDQVFDFARSRQIQMPRYTWPHAVPLNPLAFGNRPPMVGDWYSYTPYFTMCKVILDSIMNVGALIRGDDLRSEFTLYLSYCDQLGIQRPMHFYMPRLMAAKNVSLSKQGRAISIMEYKENGARAEDILYLLAQSALINPEDGWFLANVKERPRLVKDFQKLI